MATITFPADLEAAFESFPPAPVENGKFELVLDVVNDEMSVEAYGDLFGMSAEVLDPNGPGGGWPVVRYVGSAAEIAAMLLCYTGTDGIDSDLLIATIERVRASNA